MGDGLGCLGDPVQELDVGRSTKNLVMTAWNQVGRRRQQPASGESLATCACAPPEGRPRSTADGSFSTLLVPCLASRCSRSGCNPRYKSRMAITRFMGVDLAWGEGGLGRAANESGVTVIDSAGQVLQANWTRGLDDTIAWVNSAAGDSGALLFVDAPLVVTNTGSPRLAGVTLRGRLASAGWRYSDGHDGPPTDGRVLSECYPYTTLVGTPELGYETERPPYKRKPRRLPVAQWRPQRAMVCDELVNRLRRLATADPPLLLDSHPVTLRLLSERSPTDDVAYKHREDLLDAVLCAWTAALWARHGLDRCQVLGLSGLPGGGPAATIIAPARPQQR
jgi:predicted RNase H-like nuclease